MSLLLAPDGIQIGPDDRLPIFDFDEWIVTDGTEREIGTLTAGEQKTLVFNNISTVRAGARVFAQPLNFGSPDFHFDKLLIKGAWVSDANQISVLVKNDSSASVTYGVDEWSLMYFNTSNP